MSKDLALQQIEWDLHENDAIVPLEFTEEIKPDLFGLELAKAQEMTSGLSTTLAEREVLKNAYVDVIALEITTETLPIFKELRLKIVKNRTQGIEKWHKTNKAFYLAGGRFVDAVKNKEIVINEEMEAKLIEAEKFFENQEKEKARLINDARILRISLYVEDTIGLDFSPMSDEDFDDYLLGKKTRFENDVKERVAETLRIEAERLADIEATRRQLEIAPYMQFYTITDPLKEMSCEEYALLLKECQEAKISYDKQQEAQRLENEKLKKDAEAKELELQKERAKQDAILKEAQEAKAKLEAELKAKQLEEAEAENARLALLAQQTKDAEKLAKAPIKKQLTVWVDSFEISLPTVANDKTLLIAQKFEAFKIWAKNEINSI